MSNEATSGVQITPLDEGTTLVGDPAEGPRSVRQIIVDAGAALHLRLEVALGLAVGYWHPGAGSERTLPADWSGHTSTSLVSWGPVGCLHDAAGNSLFAWAADELVDELEIKFGVSEERKTFVVELRGRATETERELTLVTSLEPRPLAEAVGALAAWLADRLSVDPLPVPAVARQPVYSTWYTFTQDLQQATVLAEAKLGAALGCGSVFVDDGWQRLAHGRGYAGCGDWTPDTAKFPDLAQFCADVRAQGAGVVLWIAPLLLGADSEVFADLAGFAPAAVGGGLRCHILDPRHREVREHLAATCRRLVVDFGLDGLKIDFLDQAMIYRGTASSGDVDDVGEAMRQLLAQIRDELAAAGRSDVAVEFRQPYVSPAIGAYGQILRAGDCPGDAVVNRLSTIDAQLLSADQVVHGDMLMWGPTAGAEAVAQQLYGCWFAVPQISMRLADLAPEQSAALAGLLDLWRRLSPVALDGRLTVHGSERGYDLVRADHPELAQSVIGRYAPVVVDLDRPAAVTILNATADDTVVLRLAEGLGVSGGIVRTAAAAELRRLRADTSQLSELSVPPFGSLTIDVVLGGQ